MGGWTERTGSKFTAASAQPLSSARFRTPPPPTLHLLPQILPPHPHPFQKEPHGSKGEQQQQKMQTLQNPLSHFPRFGGDMKSRISQILKTNTGLLYPKFHTHTHTQHKHARSDPLTTSPQHLHTDQLTHTSPMFTHTHTNTHTHTRTDPMTQMGPTFSHTTHLQHGLAGLWTCCHGRHESVRQWLCLQACISTSEHVRTK